ncbi:MAG: SMC-Scp complex subunit ScpB [Saprospiraceae bacterium]|nr:SMC-Scp complex subunit ScpB [Saprospiraceae bacterium]
MEHLAQHIESLIFTAESPIPLQDIKLCLEEAFGAAFHEDELLGAIESLKQRYADDNFALEIAEIAGGYQFLTKGAYHGTVGVYLKQTTKRRLTRSALETLSIIAYKQPVSKTEVERIRGVNSDHALQKLLEKELVSIVGRSEGPGRPLLYGTSTKFMEYFGLRSMEEMPKPKEFKLPDNEIGEQAPIEEETDLAPETYESAEE